MRVKVLQWNIWYKENPKNVLALLSELRPDIICLQELAVGYHEKYPHPERFLARELGYEYFAKEANPHSEGGGMYTMQNAIYSRFPIRKTYSCHVREPGEDITDYSKQGRIYVEADIKLPDRTITAGTTHLSYLHEFHITEEKRAEVDRLLEITQSKKGDYILTGDLNSLPDSCTVHELGTHLMSCGPTFEEKTWTTKPFDYQGFKADSLDFRLDYVFSTPDVKCISSEIVQTEYSDHLPILATFEV